MHQWEKPASSKSAFSAKKHFFLKEHKKGTPWRIQGCLVFYSIAVRFAFGSYEQNTFQGAPDLGHSNTRQREVEICLKSHPSYGSWRSATKTYQLWESTSSKRGMMWKVFSQCGSDRTNVSTELGLGLALSGKPVRGTKLEGSNKSWGPQAQSVGASDESTPGGRIWGVPF